MWAFKDGEKIKLKLKLNNLDRNYPRKTPCGQCLKIITFIIEFSTRKTA